MMLSFCSVDYLSANNPKEDNPSWNAAIFFSESEKLKISMGAPLFNTMLMLSHPAYRDQSPRQLLS
jgi:hypothetical protein